jgi:hypothetical protein
VFEQPKKATRNLNKQKGEFACVCSVNSINSHHVGYDSSIDSIFVAIIFYAI